MTFKTVVVDKHIICCSLSLARHVRVYFVTSSDIEECMHIGDEIECAYVNLGVSGLET